MSRNAKQPRMLTSFRCNAICSPLYLFQCLMGDSMVGKNGVKAFGTVTSHPPAGKKYYGRRWPGTEGIISAVKRIFGERVRSRIIENRYKEAKRKFWCYAVLKRYGKEKVGM